MIKIPKCSVILAKTSQVWREIYRKFKIFISIICRKTLPSAGYKMLSGFPIVIISFFEGLTLSEVNGCAWHSTKSEKLGFKRELDAMISQLLSDIHQGRKPPCE